MPTSDKHKINMKTGPRKNFNNRNNKNTKDKMAKRIARRERSGAPGGVTQLVEIDFEKATERMMKNSRSGELKTRVRKILDTYEKAKLHTYEDYGLKNFLDAEKGKLTATVGEK